MRFLIIGYGNMGKKYAVILSKLKLEYDILDPPLKGIKSYRDYSHYIIACPNESHLFYYNMIKSYNKDAKILIEKPVVLPDQPKDIFKDENVFCSSPRRFHPITQFIKTNYYVEYPLLRIKSWEKYSPKKFDIPAVLDLGVHCYDTIEYLSGYISANNINAVKVEYKDKKVDRFKFIDNNNQPIIVDYIDNCIYNYNWRFKFDDNSLEMQLLAFIKGESCNTLKAHEVCYELCEKLGRMV